MRCRGGHGFDYVAAQQFKITWFIMHIMETINFQIRFYDDTGQKKVVSKLTTESREETLKLSFGALQYIGLIII
jgi:hypothetical protein